MADQKTTLDEVLKQIQTLRRTVELQGKTIESMQRVGGFADSKTLSMRSTRIEGRIELLELDGEMLKDVAGIQAKFDEEHLVGRHDAKIDRVDGEDVVSFRRIRKRMHEWAEKRGLLAKRTDLRQCRGDENRVRPALQS